jgi:hypothetical protein
MASIARRGVAHDDAIQDLAPVPDAIATAYRLEFPNATDGEVRHLAHLGLRLEELARIIRAEVAPAPEAVVHRGLPLCTDEYDRLSYHFSKLRTAVRLRTAPALHALSPAEFKTLETDYADWLARDFDTRMRDSRDLLNEAVRDEWGPHIEAREGLGAGAAVGERGAYWRLLCISRGLDPGDGGHGLEMVAVRASDHVNSPNPRVPTRGKDRVRWKAIWTKVRPERARNKSYQEMANWVSKDPNLKVSPDVLADIIRAGESGRLDE